jgi:hypothetical protein
MVRNAPCVAMPKLQSSGPRTSQCSRFGQHHGIVACCARAASGHPAPRPAEQHDDARQDQVGFRLNEVMRERRYALEVAIGEAIVDLEVAALDVAVRMHAFEKSRDEMVGRCARPSAEIRDPPCRLSNAWASAASGDVHAAAAPPSSVMKSRRLMSEFFPLTTVPRGS